MQALRGAVSPIWTRVGVVATHGTAFCPCVLADLYWFGINAEYIFGAINGYGYILADFFGKSGSKLTSGIELSATDQVGQILLTLMVQTMKKKILAVEAEGLSGNAKCDNLGSDSCFPRLLAIGDAIGPLLWLHSVDWWEGAV